MENSVELIVDSIVADKISDEEYFSSKYSEYISNSKLSLLDPNEGGSYTKFIEGFKNDFSESFELGGAIHSMILQPEYYEISEIKKPSGKLGVFVEEVFKLRKEGFPLYAAIEQASINANYYSGKLKGKVLKNAIKSGLPFYLDRCKVVEAIDKSLIFLSEANSYKYSQCMLEVTANPKIRQTLYPGHFSRPCDVYNEIAIFCDFKVIYEGKEYIVKFKGKLDNFTINHEEYEITLNDLKTTSKPVNYFMGNKVRTFTEETGEQWVWYDGSFQKYHYYRQMAIYMMLLQAYIAREELSGYKFNSNMVVLETLPNFKSKIFPVKNSDIKKGLQEFKKLLIELVKCKVQNDKPL
jgi:hypothetical protein